MALEENVKEQQDNGQLTDAEENELDIMVKLAENMIDEGGINVIETAKGSKDPGQVIGQFLMQLGSQLGEQLPFEISPRIMLARGGWLEQISDYLQDEYDIPKKDMDRAEIFVASSAQGMAQGQQQQGAAPAAPAPVDPMAGAV
jgi:hypothetical protein